MHALDWAAKTNVASVKRRNSPCSLSPGPTSVLKTSDLILTARPGTWQNVPKGTDSLPKKTGRPTIPSLPIVPTSTT